MGEMGTMNWLFLASATIGGLVFLVKIVMMCLGADHGDADMDAHDIAHPDADASFKLLSIQGIFAFLLMFGVVGYAMHHGAKLQAGWALAGGIGSGIVMMFVVGWIFAAARKLQSSGTLDLKNALDQEGSVYLRIPAGGTGKVQVAVQGRLLTLDANAEGGGEIKSGERIKVVEAGDGAAVTVRRV